MGEAGRVREDPDSAPVISLTNTSGATEVVDLGAVLALPTEAWWESDSIEPPGFSPIGLKHLPNGSDASLDGMWANEVRW